MIGFAAESRWRTEGERMTVSHLLGEGGGDGSRHSIHCQGEDRIAGMERFGLALQPRFESSGSCPRIPPRYSVPPYRVASTLPRVADGAKRGCPLHGRNAYRYFFST